MSQPKEVKTETAVRAIDVLCTAHNLSFNVPAASRIVCEHNGHELDDAFPRGTYWEYCCDCQTFVHCDIAKERKADEACPSCTRQFARRFVCAKCHIITCESDAPARRKAFSFSTTGGPPPTCPGCLTPTTGTAFSHECVDFGFTFSTARKACPFCQEAIPAPGKTEAPTPPQQTYQPAPGHMDELAPPPAVSPFALYCAACHAPLKPHFKFCKKCRAPVQTQPTVVAPNPARAGESVAPVVGSSAPYIVQDTASPDLLLPAFDSVPKGLSPPEAWKNKKVMAVAAVIVVIGGALLIGAAYRAASSGYSTEGKLANAIAKGNLVSPAGESAQDYYNQLKSEGASAATLSRFSAQLVPALTAHPYKVLAAFTLVGTNEPSPTEWDEAGKLLAWASALAPNDKPLAAKAAYCAGRSAYTRQQSDTALELWTRANELDGAWAVPPNGIGLIYNERKQYATARQFLTEAMRRDPQWAAPYNNMGTSYFYEKDYDDAKNYYQQARDRAPQWARPHAWLGDIAFEHGDFCDAQQEYKTALDLATPSMTSWNPQRIQSKLERAAAKCGQAKGEEANPQRIHFSAGSVTASVSGSTSATAAYVISVRANQTMSVALNADTNNATLQVLDSALNQLRASANSSTSWTGTLPYTGDYNIQVIASGGTANYTLQVTIPPLS